MVYTRKIINAVRGRLTSPVERSVGPQTTTVRFRKGAKSYGLLIVEPRNARRVIYLLPGSHASTRALANVPQVGLSMARFLAQHKVLVIGIDPPEVFWSKKRIPSYAKTQGLVQSIQELAQIIESAQGILPWKDYSLAAFSAGGLEALLAAIAKPAGGPGHVIGIDVTKLFNPKTQPKQWANAKASQDRHLAEYAAGQFALERFGRWLDVFPKIATRPMEDSGISRESLGPGNFTNLGAAYYAWLSKPWFLRGGFVTGRYKAASDPQKDRFSFRDVDMTTLQDAVSQRGSDLYPMKKRLEMLDVVLGNEVPGLDLDWRKLDARVTLLGANLGFGHQGTLLARLRSAGHREVEEVMVQGSHGEMIYGPQASEVWSYLLR